LVASAWPEPPSAIPAEPTAGAITERKRPTELASDPCWGASEDGAQLAERIDT